MGEGAITCAECGAVVRPNDAFCRTCGERRACCDQCGALLVENGDFCQACGTKLAAPACFDIPDDQVPLAYCTCRQPHPLFSGRHRFCPYTGEPIYVHVEFSKLPFYRQNIQTPLPFRIYMPHDATVLLRSFHVFLGSKSAELEDGAHSVEHGTSLSVHTKFIPAEKLFYPQPLGAESSTGGCRAGSNVLIFALEFEVNGTRYRLEGRDKAVVLPEMVTQKDMKFYLGDHIVMENQAGGVLSAGGNYRHQEININSLNTTEKIDETIREMESGVGSVYEPLALHLASSERVLVTPDWPAIEKARVWFVRDDILHNYCLLPQRVVVLGRDRSRTDVLLYEVERCRNNLRRQEQAGVPKQERKSESQVGRVQWRIEPAALGVRVTQMSSSSLGVVSDAKTLQPDEVHLMGRDECVAIPNVVGLQYRANAVRFDGVDAVRQCARSALDQMARPPIKKPEWHNHLGGYCLARLHSLTGKAVGGVAGDEDLKTAEHYVLIPGWATLGSSEDTCIPIAGAGVAPLHAALLFVDGYYFVTPLTDDAPVSVDGMPVAYREPRPIKPGSTIRLGSVALKFDAFTQMHVG